jgi:hypothetical protein
MCIKMYLINLITDFEFMVKLYFFTSIGVILSFSQMLYAYMFQQIKKIIQKRKYFCGNIKFYPKYVKLNSC